MRLTLLFFLSSITAFAQTYPDYINRANAALREHNYALAAPTYDSAFAVSKADFRDQYNAACAHSRIGNLSKAVNHLRLAFENGYEQFDWMYYDLDLNPIRNETGYLAIEKKYRPDSVVYFFDIIRQLNASDEVVICEKRVSINEHSINAYSIEEIRKRVGSDFKLIGDSLIDFSTKTLKFCKSKFDDKLDSFNAIERISLSGLEIEDCRGNLKLNKIVTKDLGFYETRENYVRNLMFDHITVNGTVTMSVSGFRFRCKNSRFDIYVPTDALYREGFVWNVNYSGIYITNSVFNSAQHVGVLTPLKFNIMDSKTLDIENCEFNYLASIKGSVTEVLTMRNNSFPEYIDMTTLKLPEFNCYIPFNQFENTKLIRFDYEEFDNYSIQGDSTEEYADDLLFDNLTGMYKRMYDSFRARADISSANSAYVRMKDLEIAHLKLKIDRSSEETMRLRLNQLMGFYTDHATSPGKALVISFYIILAFGIFYCFFPSDWDRNSKSQIIADFKVFIEKNEHGYVRPFFKMTRGLFMSLLNSVALSMNAFITLGFGNIPTTGIPRYMCIVQGMLGWFLLSLFTVALLNQVLL